MAKTERVEIVMTPEEQQELMLLRAEEADRWRQHAACKEATDAAKKTAEEASAKLTGFIDGLREPSLFKSPDMAKLRDIGVGEAACQVLDAAGFDTVGQVLNLDLANVPDMTTAIAKGVRAKVDQFAEAHGLRKADGQ